MQYIAKIFPNQVMSSKKKGTFKVKCRLHSNNHELQNQKYLRVGFVLCKYKLCSAYLTNKNSAPFLLFKKEITECVFCLINKIKKEKKTFAA